MKFTDIAQDKYQEIDLVEYEPDLEIHFYNHPNKLLLDIFQGDLGSIDLSENKEVIVKKTSLIQEFHTRLKKKSIDIRGLYNKTDIPHNKKIGIKKKIPIVSYKKIKHRGFQNNILGKVNDFYKNILFFGSNRFKNIIFLLIFCFSIFYVEALLAKTAMTKGYNTLISIKDGGDKQDIYNQAKISKLYFDVAHYLYYPYSLIPQDDLQQASNVLEGGRSMSYLLVDSLEQYSEIEQQIDNKGGITSYQFLLLRGEEQI